MFLSANTSLKMSRLQLFGASRFERKRNSIQNCVYTVYEFLSFEHPRWILGALYVSSGFLSRLAYTAGK